jgi:hypothetical protein
MRVIAFLSLLFGFMGLVLLDGQTFTHAVMGIVFGAAAFGCGLRSARKDFSNVTCRWEGIVMAVLGLGLALLCVVQLPSAYRFQTKFNERSKSQQDRKPRSANPTGAVGGGIAPLLLIGCDWSAASDEHPSA